MKKMLENILPQHTASILGKLLGQKYAIALVIFFIWVAFLDNNNVFDRASALKDLNELKETKEYFKKKVEEDTHLLNELKRNNNVLERYARERYLMKKEDEEIFIIVEE